MRTLAAVLLLIVLAFGVWAGAQWIVHRNDINATIVFTKVPKLRPGDPVKEDGRTVGKVIRVSELGDRHAVTVRINRRDRRAIVTDSLFDIKDHALVVDNNIAVGRPIDDGAILEAHDDRLARWLSHQAEAAKPYLDALRAKIDSLSDRDFTEWTKSVPDWKKEGRDAFERHVAEAQKKVAAAQEELRKSNRAAEAQKLKERFEKWLNDIRR